MDPENVAEFGWALAGEERLAAELEREDQELRERVAVDPAKMLGDFDLPESDTQVLGRQDFAAMWREVRCAELARPTWASGRACRPQLAGAWLAPAAARTISAMSPGRTRQHPPAIRAPAVIHCCGCAGK